MKSFTINGFSSYCHQNDLFLNTSRFGQNLECVDSINDLGVIFDSEQKFDIHFEAISKKAYRMLGFLIRSCKDFKYIKTHTLLYEPLVKSQYKLLYRSRNTKNMWITLRTSSGSFKNICV